MILVLYSLLTLIPQCRWQLWHQGGSGDVFSSSFSLFSQSILYDIWNTFIADILQIKTRPLSHNVLPQKQTVTYECCQTPRLTKQTRPLSHKTLPQKQTVTHEFCCQTPGPGGEHISGDRQCHGPPAGPGPGPQGHPGRCFNRTPHQVARGDGKLRTFFFFWCKDKS